MEIEYADLKDNDVIDGEGICVSLWVQGCPFHCKGCHNPSTWEHGKGKKIELQDLLNNIITAMRANGIQRNFSVLGGEPLASRNQMITHTAITEVKKLCPDAKIYLWTGFKLETLMATQNADVKNILTKVDVLIDGRYVDEQRDITLFLRGSKNQRVIDVQKTLKTGHLHLYHD